MIIPVGTDNPLRRAPMMNYILIGMNLAIFMATNSNSPEMRPFLLHPETPRLYQFITYAFLHAGIWHVGGNMLFLYIFGNNVNDKLGNIGYGLLYLGGAVFSGLGYAMVSNNPMLGASGAVAAITGAYMVLFPKTYIHIIYVIFFIGHAEIPAIYFIMFKLIIYDNVFEPRMYGGGNVAYSAHLAGYIFGIVIPMVMLWLKILPHSHYDMWALARRWSRRQQFSNTTRKGYNPFDGGGGVRRKVDVKVKQEPSENPRNEEITNLRAQIAEATYQADLNSAAEIYLKLIEIDQQQVLPQQQQLDISNKLMHIGSYDEAAGGYESFIAHYPRYPFIEQVELMLGLIYSRYLDKKEEARNHLEKALKKLPDPGQKQMCRDELDKL